MNQEASMHKQAEPIAYDIVIASLKHCAKSGVRCVECPCGGAPACKEVYARAVEIIEGTATIIEKQRDMLLSYEKEIDAEKFFNVEAINIMCNAIDVVRKAYSNMGNKTE